MGGALDRCQEGSKPAARPGLLRAAERHVLGLRWRQARHQPPRHGNVRSANSSAALPSRTRSGCLASSIAVMRSQFAKSATLVEVGQARPPRKSQWRWLRARSRGSPDQKTVSGRGGRSDRQCPTTRGARCPDPADRARRPGWCARNGTWRRIQRSGSARHATRRRRSAPGIPSSASGRSGRQPRPDMAHFDGNCRLAHQAASRTRSRGNSTRAS